MKNALIVYTCCIFLSVVFSSDKYTSLFGNPSRFDGILYEFFLIGICFALAYLAYFQKFSAKVFYVPILLLQSIVSIDIVRVLAPNLFRVSIEYFPQWASFLGHPQYAIGFLGVSFFSTMYVFERTRHPLLKLVLGILQTLTVFAIALNHSWSSMFFLGTYVLLYFGKKSNTHKKITVLTCILLLSVLLNQYAQRVLFSGRIHEFTYIIQSRERIWISGLIGWSKRPLFGWGWANYNYAFSSAQWPYPVYWTLGRNWVDWRWRRPVFPSSNAQNVFKKTLFILASSDISRVPCARAVFNRAYSRKSDILDISGDDYAKGRYWTEHYLAY